MVQIKDKSNLKLTAYANPHDIFITELCNT